MLTARSEGHKEKSETNPVTREARNINKGVTDLNYLHRKSHL